MDESERAIVHSYTRRVTMLVRVSEESSQVGQQETKFSVHQAGMQMQKLFFHSSRGSVETQVLLQARRNRPRPFSREA